MKKLGKHVNWSKKLREYLIKRVKELEEKTNERDIKRS